jgi:hypothetical protein
MATSTQSRRRPVRAVARVRRPAASSSLTANLMKLAGSRPARAAFAVIGTAGLAALAIAVVGPKRIEKDVIKPLRGALEPQAEKLWSESKPLREQIAGLFQSASPSGRERLVRSFQSWIGHFHAT